MAAGDTDDWDDAQSRRKQSIIAIFSLLLLELIPMKGKIETDADKKNPPRRFFSPETSLFEPIFATEYEVRLLRKK